MSSADGHALILGRMALAAVEDARAWWRAARASPDEQHLLAAFYWCVFASRALRRAALVLPNSAPQMIAQARRVDAASKDLLFKLVRVEGATGPLPEHP